jgi:CheY-like chemotaxis protein
LEKTTQTDVVLLDIMMPAMDGYETMRTIRTQQRFKDLLIIAVTAEQDGERQRCIEAGANDFLPKPVATAQLMEVLGSWL